MTRWQSFEDQASRPSPALLHREAEEALWFYREHGKRRFPATLVNMIWRNLWYGNRYAPEETNVELDERTGLTEVFSGFLALFFLGSVVGTVVGVFFGWIVGSMVGIGTVAVIMWRNWRGWRKHRTSGPSTN